MSTFDPEELKKFLQNYDSNNAKEQTENNKSDNKSENELTDGDFQFGVKMAQEELDKIRKAWCTFQESIKDLATVQVMLQDIRKTGEALAQAEMSLSEDSDLLNEHRASEKIIMKSKIIASVLNKYKKGE
jgi:hypothetical protein